MAKKKQESDERVVFLAQTLAIQSKSKETERMQAYILAEAETCGYSVDADDGNLYVTKGAPNDGDFYPCFVAHTDTTHKIIERFGVHRIGNAIFGWDYDQANMSGVGGDDKVGIFIALQLMRELPYAKAAFFRDEEIGCLGSAKANMVFFDDCAFALQADRNGWKDVVVKASGTELCSQEFCDALAPIYKPYERAEYKFGASTDVVKLKDNGLGICAINMSCGYYRPHVGSEVVLISDVMETLEVFRKIVKELAYQQWLHEKPKVAPVQLSGYQRSQGKKKDYSQTSYDVYFPSQATKDRYDGKVGYYSPYRADKGMSQIGTHADAERRKKMNDALDITRKNDPRFPAPMASRELRSVVDDMIELLPCPECGHLDLSVNRDAFAEHSMSPRMLFAYCWNCRCDWYAVEELLNPNSEVYKLLVEQGWDPEGFPDDDEPTDDMPQLGPGELINDDGLMDDQDVEAELRELMGAS